tara:strand:+ start:114 stop:1094 length:981 start_codon:yes stop_codon:yes gene_type:complete
MKEISFFKYILNKNLSIGEIKHQNSSNNKLLFTKFNNIFVYPKLWTVITRDLYIFNDFERYLSQYKHHKEIILNQNEIIQKIQSVSQIKGSYFLFGAEGNYWHFLIDFLPRLSCLKYISEKNIKVLISDNLPEKFLNFIRIVCNEMSIKEINFFKINQEKLIYNFESLTFTSRPSVNFASTFLLEVFKKNLVKNKIRNLYVKRGNAIRRRVLNENKLIKFIKGYNYEIIDCFELSIEEQIKLFTEAKNIIIPSGASMANLIFAPDNTKVIEIRSNLDGNFSKNINLKNRLSLYMFDKTIKVGPELRKDIIVDIDELKKIIEEKKIY